VRRRIARGVHSRHFNRYKPSRFAHRCDVVLRKKRIKISTTHSAYVVTQQGRNRVRRRMMRRCRNFLPIKRLRNLCSAARSPSPTQFRRHDRAFNRFILLSSDSSRGASNLHAVAIMHCTLRYARLSLRGALQSGADEASPSRANERDEAMNRNAFAVANIDCADALIALLRTPKNFSKILRRFAKKPRETRAQRDSERERDCLARIRRTAFVDRISSVADLIS
jgi:hypothetical protein